MAGSIDSAASKGEELAYADRPVPQDRRINRMPLTMAWWSVCSAMFYLFVSASLALAYGAMNAIIGMALAVISYALINNLLSRHAIRTGLSVSLFSRILFGRTGAAIATLIFFATAIYYAVFEGSVIAVAFSEYAGIAYPVAALIVVVYSVALIFGSIQNWLDKFNGVLLPFYVIGLVAAVVLTITTYGYSDAWLRLGPGDGAISGSAIWGTFVAYMGVWVLMMYTYDYARFGKSEDADYHARLNFGLPFYLVAFFLNGCVGIFLAASIPSDGAVTEVSVVFALIKVMGFAGLVFVWVSQTRINTANYYLAAVNMESFAQTALKIRAPKALWACVVGAISYALMMGDVFHYILQALAWQGIFVVAWVAVALVHILTEAERSHEDVRARLEASPAVNGAGLGAWFLGAGIGLVLHVAGGSLAAFSAPLSFLVAGAAYAVLGGTRAKGAVLRG